MITNYSRSIAAIALHFNRVPHEISVQEINSYLYRMTVHEKQSISYFKQAVYGLRHWFRLFGMEVKTFRMPGIKKEETLPVVLSKEECKELFKAPRSFKHRFLLAFAYAGGLRMNELRLLKIADVDLNRKQVDIRLGKGRKNRYVVLLNLLAQKFNTRQQDLLPAKYFHVVFTIPHELNSYCLNYPKALYNILFLVSKETIETFGHDPKHLGAQTGMISVLHTWGQNLSLHPHVHMIVPGGGITTEGYWKHAKSNGRYLFPTSSMSIVYKHKFMEKLKQFLLEQKIVMAVALRKKLYNLKWVVDARQPFLGPQQVIEYLGRYSHKVAISNHRIKNVIDGKVSFMYKDYTHGGEQKLMTIEADEFLRRFCLHVLPPGFMKIRHYGILASRVKLKLRMQQMKMGVLVKKKEKLSWKELARTKLNFDVETCPCCKTGKMIRIMSFEANAPPLNLIAQVKRTADSRANLTGKLLVING